MDKPWPSDSASADTKQVPSQRDLDLRDFLDGQCGVIVILSEDLLFIKTVRTSMLRALQVKRNCVEAYREPASAMTAIRDQVRTRTPVVALVDRIMAGKQNVDFLRTVKQMYPALKLIVMTYETTKDTLALLLEIGVDHVITKPVSVDTLIEKIAGVVKPQSRIVQLVQEARGYLEQRDYDKVFKICDTILEAKGKSSVALLLRGEALMKYGDRMAAIEEFEKAHKIAPLYLEPLKKLTDLYRDHDLEQFLNYMLELDSISPLNVERKCEIGKCYVRKHETESAKEFFDKAIDCAHEEAKRYMCTILSDIGHAILDTSPELAGQYLAQYFEMKGNDLSREDMIAFNNYGIALRKQGKWREALDNYNLALKIAPDDQRILYNCALAYSEGEQYAKAVELYEKVLKNDPAFHAKSAIIANNIGYAYYKSNAFGPARKFFQEALEIDPEHVSSKQLLAAMPPPRAT